MRFRRPVEMTVVAAFAAAAVATTSARSVQASICYAHPFGHVKINDPFGSPREYGHHRGVDYGASTGTGIGSIADGTVVMNTWSSCLGNVVVVAHPDGMFSGYGHMLHASPLGVGTGVGKGTIIGQVGNSGTCTTGAHLHMTLGYAASSVFSGTTIDPIPFIDSHLSCNQPPSGALDSASAAAIAGWAFDPEAGKGAIAVHVYVGGPAGDAKAVSFPIQAALARPDLCGPLGSCEHGFSMRAPRGFFDGAPHPVFAYAIDSSGGPNTLLSGSPRVFQAPPPAIPEGTILRRVDGAASFAAWRFSPLYDVAPLPGDGAKYLGETHPKGPALPTSPEIVRSTDDGDAVWVIDGGLRRRAKAKPWRFEQTLIKELAPPVLMQIPQGNDFPDEPLLVGDVGPTHYLLDTPFVPNVGVDPGDAPGTGSPASAMPPETDGVGASGAKGDATGGEGPGRSAAVVGADAAAETDAGGCAVARSSGRSPWSGLGAIGALAAAILRRRRAPRARCAT